MTVEELKARILPLESDGDPEVRHDAEDRLMRDILRAIAHEDMTRNEAQALALTFIEAWDKTLSKLGRWYA